MANTDTALASTEEIRLALGKLYELQEDDPNQLKGLLQKHPEANFPKDWPFHKNETEAFLGLFEITTTPAPEQGAETTTPTIGPYTETVSSLGPQSAVDAKKLEDLVDMFNKEIEAAKLGRVRASDASRKFVRGFIENAKAAKMPLPEAQAPILQEAEDTPVSPERVKEIISATIQQPLPVEEQKLFFHALTAAASEQPDKSVVELVSRAVAINEAASVLAAPEGTFPQEISFSALATNDFQKNAARVLDRVISPAAKKAVLLQPLNILVNHPEQLPKNVMGEMVDRWGENFVNSAWFTQFRTDANRMMVDQKSAATAMSRVSSLLLDVKTTIFGGPIFEYVEMYRIVGTQGIQMTDFSSYRNVTLGYGGQLARMGAQYAVRAGVKMGVKKIAAGFATKGGTALATAAGGTAVGGPVGTLIGLGMGLLGTIKDKIKAAMQGNGPLGVPGDVIAIVAVLVIVVLTTLSALPLSIVSLIGGASFLRISHQARYIAVLTGSGVGVGPSVNCQIAPDDPQCKFTPCVGDCRWPTSGYITQGPRTSQFCSAPAQPTHGSGSAASQNGIDFSAMGGGAVYATRTGTVERVFFGCPESGASIDPWCGGGPDPTRFGDSAHPEYAGYGNHVVLLTDNGYTIIFGHLKSAINVTYGQKIADPNTQVGWVDNSGHSFGTHLHFGVLSGGNILDLIPTDNPATGPQALDGCIQQTVGCTKICPTTPVKAGS